MNHKGSRAGELSKKKAQIKPGEMCGPLSAPLSGHHCETLDGIIAKQMFGAPLVSSPKEAHDASKGHKD